MKTGNWITAFALSAIVLLMAAGSAQAYLDPGTGGMILQAIVGAIVGGLITLKLYWAKIKNYFASRQDVPKD